MSEAIYYYHQDHIGSTNIVTDEIGASLVVYEYAPYGELKTEQGFDSQESFFEESNGLVVIEAEDYQNKTTGANGHDWLEDTTKTGYSARGTMFASPNNGTNQNTNYVQNSPRLDYNVNFTTPGVYTIWVRGWAQGSNDDSLHMGLDGQALGTSDKISGFTSGRYSWTKNTMDGTAAIISVTTPGIHTINIWMREDGIYVDKFILTLDSAYPKPVGIGPAESTLTINTPDIAYKFTGKELDETTGLYYYGARYYDPVLCHFIQPDTIVPYPDDPQSFNRYAYARNNPIRYIDPTGHSWWSTFWKSLIGGIVAGVVIALTGGAGAPFVVSAIAAGIAGGATTGALTGGWQGALIGGGIGAITGAGIGQWGMPFAIGAAAVGAGYAAATGGWEGLGDFGAGLAGGLAGGAIGYTATNAMLSTPSSVSSSGGGTNDPLTSAETQQIQRASVDIQGTTDSLSEEVGTLQARVAAPRIVLEDITQPVKDYGPRMGRVFGGVGLKAASDIKMKVPYNGKITFIPKGIVARAANALGVAAKWFGKALGVAALYDKSVTFCNNLRAGGGPLQAVHDAALIITQGIGFLGKEGTPSAPLRLVPAAYDSIDMSTDYWSGRFWNHIYGVE